MAKSGDKSIDHGRSAVVPIEICILAGGLSSRMGLDKSRLRLGRKTLLGHVRAAALETGWPVRVIRRDLVTRCGPLGGVVTALRTSRARHVMFLACDMPFVPPTLLGRLRRVGQGHEGGACVILDGLVGFPCILPSSALATVETLLLGKRLSLQGLAATLRSRRLSVRVSEALTLFNVNTPEDWAKARQMMGDRTAKFRKGALSTHGVKAKVRPC
ncbi:MAG: molybdenum cofactor guanylyltransferase [Opitutaceae bacterium]|nr:molybdenum cofactor guanylyltransferase [Verrucomicrobiales bacterium]